jgi:hypothetical protein
MSKLYDAARTAAGPEVLHSTLIIPVVLIIAFAGLNVYMRGRKKPELLTPSPANH